MDYSGLAEAQQAAAQQQAAQQQQHYQLQQQQAVAQPTATDPNQAYQQANQAYYPHYQSYPQTQNAAPHQQYVQQQAPYPYYPPEYAIQAGNPAASAGGNAPPHAAYQPQAHSDANLQPPGLDFSGMSQMPASAQAAQPVTQPNAYYPQPVAEQGPRLTPAAAAAAAALSQLSQLAGSVDAAGRAMAAGYPEHSWHGKKGNMGQMGVQQTTGIAGSNNGSMLTIGRSPSSPFRGGGGGRGGRGGRRGGAPFRRGGRRGNSEPYSRPETGAPPPFRGRGRMGGRGDGRRGPPAQPPAPASAPAPVPRPPRPPKVVAWCPICKVDCNSLEILEQHNNGKKHKKNVQKLEDAQNQKNPTSETRPKLTDQSENVQMAQDNETVSENLLAEPVNENKTEIEQQIPQVEQLKNVKLEPTETVDQRPKADSFDAWRHALKRRPKQRMIDMRWGKRQKPSEVSTEASLPKVCALCNVTCDTQAVMDCHLIGKKHLSRVKRFQGHQVVFGSADLQAFLMSQPPPAVFTPQGQQAVVYGQQAVVYGNEGQQAVQESLTQQTIFGQQVPQAADSHQVPQADYEQQAQQAGLEAEAQQATVEPVSEHTALEEGKHAISETGQVILEVGQDHVHAPGSVGAVTENAVPAASDLILPVTENAVSSSENAIVPGLDMKAEDPISNSDEPPIDQQTMVH